jgi:type III secretory pathway component EscT
MIILLMRAPDTTLGLLARISSRINFRFARHPSRIGHKLFFDTMVSEEFAAEYRLF